MSTQLGYIYGACSDRVTRSEDAFLQQYAGTYLLLELDASSLALLAKTAQRVPKMAASLVRFGGVLARHAFRFRLLELTQPQYTLGRGEQCDVLLNTDAACSDVHARINLGEPPSITDEGLTNGTLMRGRVLRAETLALAWAEPVVVGATTLSLMRGKHLYHALGTVLELNQS